MSGATALAIGGAAVVGAGASMMAADSAADSANAQTQASSQASANQLAFSKQQYNDWKDVFGDVQDNLAGYYKSLTPDSLVARGVKNINAEYAQASQSITQSLAQRGISSSGLEGEALVDLAQKQAQDTATLKASAPQLVANEKMKFLSLGLNQGQNAVAGMQNAYGSQAAIAANNAAMYNKQAAQAASGIGSSLSSGINGVMSYNAMQNNNMALTAGSTNSSGFTNLYTGPTSPVDSTSFVNW